MTPEDAKRLREPFEPAQIGRLPRIWCAACRDARTRVCTEHQKTKCADCGNTITTAHIDLAYAGHAAVTDRLLQADPQWTWEPLSLDDRGLPALDANGGLWIRLTVCGVSRLGYGDAAGKRGGDAMKETVGDAIRNGAMRFGVGLDLWAKEPLHDDGQATTARPARSPRKAGRAAEPSDPENGGSGEVADPERRRKRMFALYREVGPEDREARLADIAKTLGRKVTSSGDLSPADVEKVIAALETRKREQEASHG